MDGDGKQEEIGKLVVPSYLIPLERFNTGRHNLLVPILVARVRTQGPDQGGCHGYSQVEIGGEVGTQQTDHRQLSMGAGCPAPTVVFPEPGVHIPMPFMLLIDQGK